MNEQNAQRLMAMLTQDFGKKVGNLVSPLDKVFVRSWCVQGATENGFHRAVAVALSKGWLSENGSQWVITELGAASVKA